MKSISKIEATSGAWKIELNGMAGLGSFELFNFLTDARAIEKDATVTRNGDIVAYIPDLANATNKEIGDIVDAVRRIDYAAMWGGEE